MDRGSTAGSRRSQLCGSKLPLCCLPSSSFCFQLLLQYSGDGINRVLRLLASKDRHPVALYCTAGVCRRRTCLPDVLLVFFSFPRGTVRRCLFLGGWISEKGAGGPRSAVGSGATQLVGIARSILVDSAPLPRNQCSRVLEICFFSSAHPQGRERRTSLFPPSSPTRPSLFARTARCLPYLCLCASLREGPHRAGGSVDARCPRGARRGHRGRLRQV